MAINNNPVKCKSCARVLATVSPTGLSPDTVGSDTVGCETCQRFRTLYDDVRAADASFAALSGKRDTLTKHVAREKHKTAHMEFDNWLMHVEAAPAIPDSEQDENSHDNMAVEEQGPVSGNEQHQQGIRRRRSHSPNTQNSGDIKAQENFSGLSPLQQQGLSLSLRPSPKRSRSTTSLPERKRLKFSDSVEFRENYRSSEEYHRPSETYVPGRNAPPEGSEYMDTSGSGLSFLRFTGMKRVGAKWVEVSEEELAKKSEDTKVSAELRRLRVAQKSAAEEIDEDFASELKQGGSALPDERAARLARRAKATPIVGLTQNKSTIEARNSKLSRSTKQESLDRGLDDAPGLSASIAANAITNDSTTGEPSVAQEIEAVQDQSNKEAFKGAILEAMHDRQTLEANLKDTNPSNDLQVMAKHQNETVNKGANRKEVELDITIESDFPRHGPRKEASCIAWEDAYLTSF